MALEVKGVFLEIHDTQQVSDKFKKREFVLKIENGQYADEVLMQTIQDKTALLDAHKVGDEVTVSFNLRGRVTEKEGTKKHFTNIEAWRFMPSAQ